ncbi:hypothetical protein NMY22_g1589 [Coprinellus aureogranulatus]|nr:hypothetical protein NMY22_g1589 [Coprinellus aureogranulatus]
MGKTEKKTGKGRLDKYYKLAKEQGYRARSAFKLIQLNKKYSFLEGSKCTIDLCAAPGGWLQVASNSPGVDLVPIKPIPRVVTFAADITTAHCRNLLRGEMKDWKADVVLHDGAPNVGTAWIQDAFTQSELVLMSLKLAVEFLIKGGTFVTKVFRSVDYNNLIWVFNQLFGKVEATKPPSSRNVSAEIFVVCRDFLAPKYIDPKFLDPKHVFKDLSSLTADKGSSANDVQANVFHPEKKRRHRDGYADGDYTLFKSVDVSTFVNGADPIGILGSHNKITFNSDEEKTWLKLPITKEEIKACCDDLKVLGKGDFKALLKWRLAIREELGLDVSTKNVEEVTEAVEITEEVDEEQQIQDELERLSKEAAARAKRERRRANEIKTRTIQRMQLQMTAPLDIGMEQSDAALNLGQDDIFDLEHTERSMKRRNRVDFMTDNDGDVLIDEDEDDAAANQRGPGEEESVLDDEEERERKVADLEAEMDGLYETYRERLQERDARFKVKEQRKRRAEKEEWHGVQDQEDSEGSDGEESEGGWDVVQRRKLEVDSDSDDSDFDEEEEDMPNPKKRSANAEDSRVSKRRKLVPDLAAKPSGQAASLWFQQDVFAGLGDLDVQDNEDEEGDEMDASSDQESSGMDVDGGDTGDGENSDDYEDEEDFEVVPGDQSEDETMWDVDGENEDAVKQDRIRKHGLLTAEAVSLAQALVNKQITKTELINNGFNRYALNDKDNLPSWFLEEEARHYKPNIPVTKEAIAALRAKQRALDARPIKKVAEAKARKKMKAQQKLEKAMKKAEGVISTADMTEREKAEAVDKLMKKGASAAKKAKKEVKLVVARGANKGIKGRPKGVKGRYHMVDPRMKKELRAKKRKEKATKKRK